MDELMRTLDTILEDITKIQEKQTAQLKFMEQKLIQLNSDLETLLSVIDSVNYTDEQEKPTSIH
jgi:TolA-binding protein